ncbi:hypothetical protein QYE76_027551 [Lolium multiflorum]|uniref:Uncharacterized protein n=1 Tax=Lolium multiflorum TaxID=4521 RepID=A0AAD8QJA8_LOLMU|nr:hypothetical protein QYE76_027551 [Lolium multiflorum]
MQWHAEREKSEEDPEMGYMLTHPSGAGQWEALDIAFPRFGGDARNIRLEKSKDGLKARYNLKHFGIRKDLQAPDTDHDNDDDDDDQTEGTQRLRKRAN